MLITILSAKRLPVNQLSGDRVDVTLHEMPLIGKFSSVDVVTYVDDIICKVEDISGSPTPLYYHSERQFNVRGLTDSTGAVKELYAYSVYGKQTVMDATGVVLAGTAEDNNYGFTGRYLDAESDLWYFRARYFSDELGRFISRDPLGYIDGMSLYGGYFASGFGLDPWGLSKCDVLKNQLKAVLKTIAQDTVFREGALQALANINTQLVERLKELVENKWEMPKVGDWDWVAANFPDVAIDRSKPVPDKYSQDGHRKVISEKQKDWRNRDKELKAFDRKIEKLKK